MAQGKTQVGDGLGLYHPKPKGQCTQWTATDHIGAPPPCPLTADPPQMAEVGGQWSQPVLAADWPEYIPSTDLPTATKSQLQQEGVLSPHNGHTSGIQLGE